MKKLLILSMLALLLLGLSIQNQTLSAAAEKEKTQFYSWSNDLGRQPNDPPYLTLHYRLRTMYFSIDLHDEHPLVFLGDSITDEGEWDKLFPNSSAENRGIGGDSTLGLLKRLDQVITLHPSKIFLMIGTNDLCYNRSIKDTLANYNQILAELRVNLPNTQVYVQSVLPFNDTIFPSRGLRTNSNILQLNAGIKKLASQYNYPYIDLVPAFSGLDGRLPAQYTRDGLHLDDSGYQLWRDQLKPMIR
ncbi:MAG: lysophospholipase L1-like esterase [Firmicutes bacterium]|nr:lysophospholipase L1-like esterase [Bacillota bacterium]